MTVLEEDAFATLMAMRLYIVDACPGASPLANEYYVTVVTFIDQLKDIIREQDALLADQGKVRRNPERVRRIRELAQEYSAKVASRRSG